MASKRVRIKSLEGGTTIQRKSLLRGILFSAGVKFSRLIEANDAFIAACLDDDDVDKCISIQVRDKLKDRKFEVIIPPPLRARKSIVIRRLEPEVTSNDEQTILDEIETYNDWAKLEEVVKLRGIPHMLKIRFAEIAMARKAISHGLIMFSYHISPKQIEQEEFYPITPCWVCYSYGHSVKDCPTPDLVICSECATTGHKFRQCSSPQQKCINCSGDHRTLAAQCPVRKDIIKRKRDESRQRRTQTQTSYAQTVKSNTANQQTSAPKHTPAPTVLQLNNDISFKIMTITINAHLINIAKPGTFGKTVKNLLRLNGLPEVILPDNAPSAEIFGIISGSNFNTDVNLQLNDPPLAPQPPPSDDEMSEDEQDVDVIGNDARIPPHPPPKSKPTKMTEKPIRSVRSMENLVATTSTSEPDTRVKIHTYVPQDKQLATTSPTPCNSPEPQRRDFSPADVEVSFFSSEEDKIPHILPPYDLMTAINTGRVKFTYRGTKIPETTLLRWFTEGRIHTKKTPIKTVDRAKFRKTRNGWSEYEQAASKSKVRIK